MRPSSSHPIMMINYCGLLVAVSFITGWFKELVTAEELPPLFIPITSCKVDTRPGAWCEWGPWSACTITSCTRTRSRQCACPTPPSWNSKMVCDTSRPQDDYFREGELIRHTRYVRRTTTKERCQLPIIIGDKYYPDCIPRAELEKLEYKDLVAGAYFCKVSDKLKPCEMEGEELAVFGMEERDVGACDGWSTTSHRRTNALPDKRLTYGADSELGMQCSFYASEALQRCSVSYFFGEKSFSDYGRLTNLAFEIHNCRFACAIRRECRGIEFVKGVSCTMIMDRVSLAPENYLGVTVEGKSDECKGTVFEPYPYRDAVAYLENKYGF